MVQVVENRADIEGSLIAVREDEIRPGHKLATIAVTAARTVENFPNLFTNAAGTRLEVIVPSHLIDPLQPGSVVVCRIRRAGPATVYAEHCAAGG